MRTSAIALMCFLTTAVVAEAQAPSSMSPPPGTLHAPTRTGAGTSKGQPTTRIAQYKTESEAKQACAGDPVVWANTSSKVLHASGDKYYGHAKRGAYVAKRRPRVPDTIWPSEGRGRGLNQDGFFNRQTVRLQQLGAIVLDAVHRPGDRPNP